ncbi:precursor of CEP9-like [Abrus precatorius]|uniref:Precursor of CEP9-like n=1 Tax=Abrus precatorius TaxID=3816 RepID=A0A8B8KXM9_ABRPR|nr:precursor of CEP9-like [Abrus precatorius]
MGKFLVMHKYFAVFLALVACHHSLLTHGRQIKPLKQHSSLNKGTVALVLEPTSKSTLQPLKASANVPTPSLKNVNSPPMIPKYATASFEDSDDSGNINAFRPTTPGGSPGVGHRMITKQDVEVSVTEGTTKDFKPTDPGHSPGVGHSHQNKIGQPN